MSEHDERHANEPRPVEERNVERLLGKAYRPETPSASFVADVTGRMLDEAAARQGNRLRMEDHMRTSGNKNWRVWIPWAIAAMVMIAIGIVAVVVALGKYDTAVRREGAVVWINGDAYVPA